MPPRPASYTPSANEPSYIPLNNLDTIRSYGSAADDLEAYPMLGLPSSSMYPHSNNSADYHPNLNHHHHQQRPAPLLSNSGHTNAAGGAQSPTMAIHESLSDSDSLRKPCWSDLESNLKGSYYESAKIHNGTLFFFCFSSLSPFVFCGPLPHPRTCLVYLMGFFVARPNDHRVNYFPSLAGGYLQT